MGKVFLSNACTSICANMEALRDFPELLRGLPDARLIMFERSGHAPFVEEPAPFARAVERFLNNGIGGPRCPAGSSPP